MAHHSQFQANVCMTACVWTQIACLRVFEHKLHDWVCLNTNCTTGCVWTQHAWLGVFEHNLHDWVCLNITFCKIKFHFLSSLNVDLPAKTRMIQKFLLKKMAFCIIFITCEWLKTHSDSFSSFSCFSLILLPLETLGWSFVSIKIYAWRYNLYLKNSLSITEIITNTCVNLFVKLKTFFACCNFFYSLHSVFFFFFRIYFSRLIWTLLHVANAFINEIKSANFI